MSKLKKILIVCTGNSCRSVMAFGLLKEMLKGKGDYQIMTAGIAAIKGMPASAETIQIMAEENIDVSGHRTQPVNDEMLNEADLILVMEHRHKTSILLRKYIDPNKVYLLSEFGRIENENKLVNPDVPDPIGRPLEFYRKVLGIIKESIVRTAKILEPNGD